MSTVHGIPEAVPEGKRRGAWLVWLVPAAAAVVALWLWIGALLGRGPLITVELGSAHGLSAGDVLQHRGMVAGTVQDVELDADGGNVRVILRLRDDAEGLARDGSRFWVERPMLGVEGVRGLGTVIRGPHLEVLPGAGAPRRRFVGLDQPPVRGPELADGLELVLEGPRRGGLVPGAPVLYRQVPVGKVLSCGLAVDARTVEVRLAIEARYAGLVRADTRFWQVGGVQLEAGILNGLTMRLDSLAALALGGIAFATPEDHAPEPVVTGHRFKLHRKPDDDWLDWTPSLPVNSAALGGGVRAPVLRRAALSWVEAGWWTRKRSHAGWVLPLGDAVLGPADLVVPPANDDIEQLRFELGGVSHELVGEAQVHGLLALRRLPGVGGAPPAALRAPGAVEDLVLVDGDGAELVLAASRLRADGDLWALVDGRVLDPSWHGAAACALADGAVIGFAVVGDGSGGMVPVDDALRKALTSP